MCRKTLLLFLVFASLAKGGLPPVTDPVVHQFRVEYACLGSTETRTLLVDADSAEEARGVVQNMIPCGVILKVTEVILYEE